MSVDKWDRAKPVMTAYEREVRRRRDRDDRRREGEDTMTIDHDRFAEANQPPPESAVMRIEPRMPK